MLTQPTTDKILLAIADDLNSVVLPSVTDDQQRFFSDKLINSSED